MNVPAAARWQPPAAPGADRAPGESSEDLLNESVREALSGPKPYPWYTKLIFAAIIAAVAGALAWLFVGTDIACGLFPNLPKCTKAPTPPGPKPQNPCIGKFRSLVSSTTTDPQKYLKKLNQGDKWENAMMCNNLAFWNSSDDLPIYEYEGEGAFGCCACDKLSYGNNCDDISNHYKELGLASNGKCEQNHGPDLTVSKSTDSGVKNYFANNRRLCQESLFSCDKPATGVEPAWANDGTSSYYASCTCDKASGLHVEADFDTKTGKCKCAYPTAKVNEEGNPGNTIDIMHNNVLNKDCSTENDTKYNFTAKANIETKDYNGYTRYYCSGFDDGCVGIKLDNTVMECYCADSSDCQSTADGKICERKQESTSCDSTAYKSPLDRCQKGCKFDDKGDHPNKCRWALSGTYEYAMPENALCDKCMQYWNQDFCKTSTDGVKYCAVTPNSVS